MDSKDTGKNTENTVEDRDGKIIERDIEAEMKTAYIDYAMSVIVSRALPDVRDGLKPVHRRILYTMYEDGLTSGKARETITDIAYSKKELLTNPAKSLSINSGTIPSSIFSNSFSSTASSVTFSFSSLTTSCSSSLFSSSSKFSNSLS